MFCIQQSSEVQASQHMSSSQNLTSSLCNFSDNLFSKTYLNIHQWPWHSPYLNTISNTTYYYISTALKESLFQNHNEKRHLLIYSWSPFINFLCPCTQIWANNNMKVIWVSRQIIWTPLRTEAHFDCKFSFAEIIKATKIDSFRVISPGSSSDEVW